MKKDKEISKYTAEWQIIRSSIKGSKVHLNDKIHSVMLYFYKYKTKCVYERCYNYLEGLKFGYIACDNLDACNLIDVHLDILKHSSISDRILIHEQDNELNILIQASFKTRYLLYTDLFKRGEKWLLSGYLHKEHENFLDLIIKSFKINKEESLIKTNYSFNKLEQLRLNSKLIKNTHKFFF